jgi:GNAT superfamily N-acetyltransferase
MIRPARPDDVPTILQLIQELAEYERARHEARATPEQLQDVLFGEAPTVFAHLAEHPGAHGPEVAGFALWFLNFSTWTGRHGIYLEDLFVDPAVRGGGVARALMEALAAEAISKGYRRLEWAVLDWNDLAKGFYRRLGARHNETWEPWRLDGDALKALAGQE